ncbi:MAG: putative toxin-antitoxin system toxin component, PIN family [Pedobacter sp.]|nr:MAG: putative toxin-antitoxin system toxin component, PIN family [Pedobacter sp.]
MRNQSSRIVLDTNLWISFLISKDFSKLDEILFSKKAVLVFSQELLDEFLEVVSRPKIRKYFRQDDLENLLETIDEYAEFIVVEKIIDTCRDKKDNFLLGLCVDGKVDFLLTGDKDLLILNPFEKTTITTLSNFIDKDFQKILNR